MPTEIHQGDYLISDDPQRIDADVIHAYLARESYWAKDIPREIVDCAIANSLCIGAYAPDGAQVGLVRVVTDYATYAWICDVFVLEAHRRRGLSKALMQAVLAHPRLQRLRRFALGTRDAHGLYAQFGFVPLAHPESAMEKRLPHPYGPPPAA